MIRIKRIGIELSGILYITEKGTYLIDTNFSKSNNTKDMSIYKLSMNDPDGEPLYKLKSD